MSITTELIQDLRTEVSEAISAISWPQTPSNLYDPARYSFSTPGKQIRPLLSLLGAGLVADRHLPALPAAQAVEVLHTFTLVHDDIMDQADKRRGALSVFKRWDTSTAILSGDVIFARAMQLLLPYGSSEYPELSKEHYVAMQNYFLNGITEICEGQALDMAFAEREVVQLSEYLDMIDKKTAALLSVSLVLGGMSVNATSTEIEALEQIGQKAGLAFQIQDDLLDIQADSQTSGKVRGGDIREGKMTFLSILALQRAEPKDKEILTASLGNREATDQDIQEIFELMQKYHVISDAQKSIENEYQDAIQVINQFNNTSYQEALTDLLDHLITRSF
jgi:geranylgeranyl diphosphate synthase type II